MRNKRRNGDRYCFNFELQPEGELLLLVGEKTFEVWKLLDISPFGVGLSIDQLIDKGSLVTLQYRHREDDIKVVGTVAWSGSENSREEGAGFRLGVDFQPDKIASNVALFKVITDPAITLG